MLDELTELGLLELKTLELELLELKTLELELLELETLELELLELDMLEFKLLELISEEPIEEKSAAEFLSFALNTKEFV